VVSEATLLPQDDRLYPKAPITVVYNEMTSLQEQLAADEPVVIYKVTF